jgi:hypothetical protein
MKKIIFFLVLSILFSVSSAIAKTPLTEEQGAKKTATQTFSANMENMAQHLELLGYRIEKNNYVTTTGKPYFIAYHESDNNIVVIEYMSNFIILRTMLTTSKPLSADMKDFSNKANKSFTILRMYLNTDEDKKGTQMSFVAVYIGEYKKQIFGSFLNEYKSDINSIRAMEDYDKVFLNK